MEDDAVIDRDGVVAPPSGDAFLDVHAYLRVVSGLHIQTRQLAIMH